MYCEDVCACVYGLADTLLVELYFIVLTVKLLVSTAILLLHGGSGGIRKP